MKADQQIRLKRITVKNELYDEKYTLKKMHSANIYNSCQILKQFKDCQFTLPIVRQAKLQQYPIHHVLKSCKQWVEASRLILQLEGRLPLPWLRPSHPNLPPPPCPLPLYRFCRVGSRTCFCVRLILEENL